MCGISGLVDLAEGSVSPAVLQQMTDAIAHHGQIDWRQQPIEILDKEHQQLQSVVVWPFLESIAWGKT